MTETVIVTRCCGAPIRTERVDVPPPPGALLETLAEPPDEWTGHAWVCARCGAQVGFTYDYGQIDLGIIRDSQLTDAGPLMDVEVFP